MRDERRAWTEQQCVVVARAHEGGDCNETIPAGPVLDHYRFAPAFRQSIGEKPRGGIDA